MRSASTLCVIPFFQRSCRILRPTRSFTELLKSISTFPGEFPAIQPDVSKTPGQGRGAQYLDKSPGHFYAIRPVAVGQNCPWARAKAAWQYVFSNRAC